MKKDLFFLTQNLIAHRGMHDINKGIPENSLKAFDKAVKHNYLIELDLHILKDGKVVVFHDDNLFRMTGINKNIKDCVYDEIKNLKLQNTDYSIPLFSDVISLINGRVPLVIELKYDVRAGLLEKEAMNLLKDYKGAYVIKSFSPFSIFWLKRHYPNAIRGFLSSNMKYEKCCFFKKYFLRSNLLLKLLDVDFISFAIDSLPDEKVKKFREKHIVLGWTVRSKADFIHAKQFCDNLICENFDEIQI